MKKTMEQIILEGQVAKCRSLEELYVLWELMQQTEEDPDGKTCYPELDQRNFHIDGIADPEHYDGTLYILKETNMRKMIQKGETMPVVSDCFEVNLSIWRERPSPRRKSSSRSTVPWRRPWQVSL